MEYGKSLTAYKYCIIILGYLNVCPFEWKKKGNASCLVQKPKISLFYLAFTIWLALDMVYLSVVTFQKIKNFDGNIAKTVTLTQHTLSRGGCLVGHIIILSKIQSKADFINQFIQVDKVFKDKFPALAREVGHTSRIIWALTLLTIFQPLGPLMAHLGERHSVRYWPSQVLPSEIYNSYVGVLFFAYLEYHLSVHTIAAALYFANLMLLYISSTLQCLRQLQHNDGKNSNGRQEIKDNARFYMMLRLLNIRFNKCYSTWWALCNLFLFVNHVGFSAAVMRCRGLLPLPYYSFLIMAVGLALWFERSVMGAGGLLFAESLAVIKSHKRSPNRIERKFFLSCRTMSVNVGSFYFLEPATGLKFIAFAVDNTINILLM